MPIMFKCPWCKKQLNFPVTKEGQTEACPECKKLIDVPNRFYKQKQGGQENEDNSKRSISTSLMIILLVSFIIFAIVYFIYVRILN